MLQKCGLINRVVCLTFPGVVLKKSHSRYIGGHSQVYSWSLYTFFRENNIENLKIDRSNYFISNFWPGLSCVYPDKDPAVEVDTETEKGLDVSSVSCRMRLNALQQDSQPHLVTTLGLERDGAILGVAGLGSIATEDGHVGSSHTQQPTWRFSTGCSKKMCTLLSKS